MKLFKKYIWKLLNISYLGGMIQLLINSSLKEDGWYKSFQKKESVDKDGYPIAWCTYPFLKFIYPRLRNTFELFEYGCGNSTIWYSKKVKNITSVEHDKLWIEKIKNKMPSNCSIIYKELIYNGEYSNAVSIGNKKYDIIIIDGRDRNNSLLQSVNYLSPEGVIVFDNSYLNNYQESINKVLSQGFKKLDFYGIGPVAAHTSCTSILYRNNNCLNI